MQGPTSKKAARSYARTPVSTAVMLALASPAVFAQATAQIEEITVTAQKREESMQDVPISIQALNNQTLTELNLQNFKDYTQMLPTVAIQPSIGAGSTFTSVYMRGIVTGGDGQATTSQPSVGMYLDELPLTTIQGNLDVHMYDVSRVEALAGPQGTLYGASSQAGTIRIITNRPVLGETSGSVSVEGNIVDGDDTGYLLEGFVNLPIGDNAAIRLVGWSRSDAGWIDNVAGTRTFTGVEDQATCDAAGVPCSADDITLDNSALAKENYNTIDTVGARAALRVDLNDNWTITPTLMVQSAEGRGAWGDDLSDFTPGDFAVTHFQKEYTDDEWWMAGLTIEGRVANLDVVYSGSYLDRSVDGSFDYTDYSYWYDTIYTTGFYADLHFADTGARPIPNMFEDALQAAYPGSTVGSRIMGGTYFTNDDNYTKQNHEIRISTDPEKRVRGMVGFFWQHQYHDFEQHWQVDGLGSVMLMNEGQDPRFAGTVYLNSFDRDDRDRAYFGQVSFDINDDLTLDLGARFFEPSVTVKGFFGFGLGFTTAGWSSNGENRCNLTEGSPGWTPSFNGQEDYKDKPCLNVDKGIKESESIYRVNLNWRLSDTAMVYGTWSEGYRPGGINRNPFAGDYISDFLTNYEVGWKTQWANNTVQFNGAAFLDQWDDFQVSFTGANAITQVDNGPSAEVLGVEAQLVWLPTDNLRITAAGAWYDSELKDDYNDFNADGTISRVKAPKGTKLPVTADFKGNVVARYHFPVGGFDGYVQGAVTYEGERGSDLDQADNDVRGDVPAYTIVDLAAGIHKETYGFDLFIKNATGEDALLYLTSSCATGTCGAQNYGVRVRPMTIALKFTKDFF